MRNWRMIITLLAVLSLLAAACGGDDDGISTAEPPDAGDEGDEDEGDATDEPEDEGDEGDAGGELSASLLGAGASFPDPVYQTWIGEYQSVQPGVSVQYEAIGSGGGRERFIAQETDFAGSDAYASDEEIADAIAARGCGEVLHIPMVFGGVAVAHNLEGVGNGELVLDSATVADIFSGEIDSWDDPAIADLNPDLELPGDDIIVTVRADGSGTTSIFTTYLEDEDADWAADYGSGDEVPWFDGVVRGEQNDGVASAMTQQPGAIGYLSLEFAVSAGLPFASLVNSDGNAIEPSTASVGAAVDGIELPEDLRFDVLGVGGEGYPIAGATWVLAYTCGMEEDKAEALRDYLTWALEEGDSFASDLGYAPLSDATQALSLEKVSRINEDG